MGLVKDSFDKFGKYLVQQSRSNLTREGHKNTSKLYNSLSYDLKESKNSIEFTFNMETYGEFLDKGVRGAGGVRKTTSNFRSTNNKGKLWKIKAKKSKYRFGKSGGISPTHFKDWAESKGLSAFAVAKSVYHQGIETTLFYSKPFERGYKRFPDEVVEAYALTIDNLLENTL